MVTELYDALRSAGADDARARAAAQAVARYRSRQLAFERDLGEATSRLMDEIRGVEARLTGEIRGVGKRLSGEICGFEARLSAATAESKTSLLMWMIPFLAAQTLGVLALVARVYLPPG